LCRRFFFPIVLAKYSAVIHELMLVIIEKHIYAKTISALSTFNCHELQVVGYLQFDLLFLVSLRGCLNSFDFILKCIFGCNFVRFFAIVSSLSLQNLPRFAQKYLIIIS
jgi:hypothetical protein